MARVLLGVSGGIAAYKALEFARLAIKAGHLVRVVQTKDSLHFVGQASFEGITGAPVLVSQFEKDPAGGVFPDQERPRHDPISHLELASNCDVLVIAPATATTIAKLAGGFADNMLTALALTCKKPIVVAPAMNNDMYLDAATQENIETLRRRGFELLEPGTGELASKGEFGIGRLPEPAELLAAVERSISSSEAGRGPAASDDPRAGADERAVQFSPRSLDGMRVLVTAGGTREPIDSVRFVGNRSSGKMGFAIASEAAARGANVTVVAANVALERDTAVSYVDVTTAAELETAVRERFPEADVLIMAAAVADFRPVDPSDGKIKKQGRDSLEIRLEPTSDVLAGLADLRRQDQVVVGFAAEAGDSLLPEAQRKLESKGLDMIVANDIADPAIGFESDANEVVMISRDGNVERPARQSKSGVAGAILDRVQALAAAASRS